MPSWNKYHKIIAVVGIVLIVFLIGWRWQTNQNKNLLGRALREAASASSWHTDFELSLQLPFLLGGQERPFNKITIESQGDLLREAGETKYSGTVHAEARGRGNAFFSSGDFVIFPQTIAFKLNEFPALLNPTGSLVNTWTHVESSLLTTNNPQAIQASLAVLANVAEYQGKEVKDGQSLAHFSGLPSEQQEEMLAAGLRFANSGNRILDQVAVLIDSNDIKEMDIYVDPSSKEITELKVLFERPRKDQDPLEIATLVFSLTDYDKKVIIEEPPVDATVRPEVFGRLFSNGQVEQEDVEEVIEEQQEE